MGKSEVEAIVNKLVLTKGSFSSGELARRAKISRQAVHRYLRALLAEGRIVVEGQGRGARYSAPAHAYRRRFRAAGLEEDRVWDGVRKHVADLDLPTAVRARAVLAYAFTEMLNNAIDHSGSAEIEVAFENGKGIATFTVSDEGMGAFENIRARFRLPDLLSALQEVSKGKVSTQPERHTGEGIFFTSKVADLFEIEANGLRWIVDNRRDDVAIAEVPPRAGTIVRFEVSLGTSTELSDVFSRYSRDDFQFDTSRVVVKLFEHGVEFVSRSEAKRLVSNLERFRHVIFDFRGVGAIGQGFADEIFRVWAVAHPAIAIETVNVKPTVQFMIDRSRKQGAPQRLE